MYGWMTYAFSVRYTAGPGHTHAPWSFMAGSFFPCLGHPMPHKYRDGALLHHCSDTVHAFMAAAHMGPCTSVHWVMGPCTSVHWVTAKTCSTHDNYGILCTLHHKRSPRLIYRTHRFLARSQLFTCHTWHHI